MIFICGEIKDLVSDSDKHSAYLEDPDDIDLNGEFDGLSEDEVENLKRKYVHRYACLFWLTQTHDCQAGSAVTQPSENSTTSSPTSRRKLMKGRLKSSVNFMQKWVTLFWRLVYSLTESALASARC